MFTHTLVAVIAIAAWFTLFGADRRCASARAIAAPPAQDAELPIVLPDRDPAPDGSNAVAGQFIARWG